MRMRRLARLFATGLLAACSPAAPPPQSASVVRDGLQAYREGYVPGLDTAIMSMEDVADAARGMPAAHWEFTAAARLRALRSVLTTHAKLSPQARLLYAERLCDADSWLEPMTPDEEDKRTGCGDQSDFFAAWRAALGDPPSDPEAELIPNGYVRLSPRRISNLPSGEDVVPSH